MSYKNKEKRREYVRRWRANRKRNGHYGKCKDCGCNLGRGNKVMYCKECHRGENHFNWNGGYKNGDGYVVINVGNRTTKLQHRVVMEEHLGRELYEDETVHHINGVRDDNRLENLELWVGAPTRGIRTGDAVRWAKEILRRYEKS